MTEDILDRRIGSVLIAIAIGWIMLVLTTVPDARIPGNPGPQAFPLLLGAAIGLLGLILILRRVFQWVTTKDHVAEPVSKPEVRLVGLTFLMLLAYAFLLDHLGFVAATPLMIFAIFWIIGARRVVPALLTAVVLTGGSYLLFAEAFGVNLPRGTWLGGLL